MRKNKKLKIADVYLHFKSEDKKDDYYVTVQDIIYNGYPLDDEGNELELVEDCLFLPSPEDK